MPGQRRGRSLESWDALTQGNRRRWIRAYGGNEDAALEAYRSGERLTTAQRGHGATPERPIRALLQPWKYPGYVGTHTEQLNELARQRGLAQHGRGPRGEIPETRSYTEAGGDFTWVLPPGIIGPPDWRFSSVFRTLSEAQLYARRSWAPAGVVQIVDLGPDHVWRYEVWFGGSPGPGGRGRRNSRRRP